MDKNAMDDVCKAAAMSKVHLDILESIYGVEDDLIVDIVHNLRGGLAFIMQSAFPESMQDDACSNFKRKIEEFVALIKKDGGIH